MSIIKRGKKYGVKVTVHGNQEWVGTFDTRRAAKAAEAKHLAKHKPRDGDEETCEEFSARWPEDFPRARASTRRHYQQAVSWFGKEFGSRPLDSITRKEARRWAQDNRSRMSTVRTMFGDALNEGLVDSNPFANLRLAQSRGRRDINVLTVAEVSELAATAAHIHGSYGMQYAAMINFAAYTGLRRNELCALEWTDIDFENGEITVDKTLSNETEILPPKNGESRVIVLPPQARAALANVPRRIDTPRIFSTKTGKRFTKSTWHYAWNPVRIAFGRPELDWHELRHFTATFLVQELNLPPRQAAQQLGHRDGGRLILQLYAHPDEQRMRAEIRSAFAVAS